MGNYIFAFGVITNWLSNLPSDVAMALEIGAIVAALFIVYMAIFIAVVVCPLSEENRALKDARANTAGIERGTLGTG